MSEKNKILLSHGSGGKLTHNLIKDIFLKYFNNDILGKQTDSALLNIDTKDLAFTTDSYVVDPIFFPGGDIGKLAVCGTVNDLAVSGAKPLYLSASFIIEEGFPIDDLETIVKSMAKEAKKAGVKIVTGDTKVVDKGKCDKIFINTTGIGSLSKDRLEISSGSQIEIGDKIIVNGNIGEHGMAVMSARNELNFEANVESDCASLNGLIHNILWASKNVKFMRDATRGGVGTVLCEIAGNKKFGIEIEETKLPISENVKGMCEIFGFDPLYVANEGKLIVIVPRKFANKVLTVMKSHELGKNSSIIGQIVKTNKGLVVLKTEIGGSRIVDMLSGAQLPRIC
ncbi:MAG: hydrogenase expression/formation protein HypE [Saprospiraceae bacterium]|nr:hydrogenase expression/formation protein HypE [Saprospiraceae bacterium]